MGVVLGLLGLGLLMLVHELGHFWMGKFFGVPIERLSLGIGPKLLGIKKGRTEYVLAAIPFVAYVKFVEAKDLLPHENPNTLYENQHPFKRLLMLFCGPLSNFLFAFALAIGLITVVGIGVYEPVIGVVRDNSPAQTAGLRPGDIVSSYILSHAPQERHSVKTFQDIVMAIQNSGSAAINFTVQRQGEAVVVVVTPQEREDRDAAGQTIRRLVLGIEPAPPKFIHDPRQTVPAASRYVFDCLSRTVGAVQKLFTSQHKEIVDQSAGPVGIVTVTDQVYKTHGFSGLTDILIQLGLGLAVLNLIPFIFILDGGQMTLVLWELVTGRSLAIRTINLLQLVSICVMLLFFIEVTTNDISRLFSK